MADPAPPAVAVPPPPVPQPAAFYAEYYQIDPYGGQYAGLYEAFSVAPGDDRPTPAQIRGALAAHPEDKLAFVMFAADGRTVLLHRVRQYFDSFGGPTGPLNGALLAVKGEAHAMGVNIVLLPENAFALVEGMAPNLQAVVEALGDAEPGADDWLMGPFEEGAEGVVATTVRRLMLVPNRYIGPLLADRLTPRQLWERVVQPLLGDHLEHDSALFVAWARRAIVNVGDAAAQSIRLPMPPVIELEGRLAEHTVGRLYRDLPARDPATQGGGNVAGLLAAGFGSMSSALDRQTASADQRVLAQKAEEQSVSGRWGSIGRLLRICRVETEEELPPIYRAAAKAGKKVDRIVLQDELALQVAADGTSLRYPFVRAQLAKSFSELKFRANYAGCRETGMSIYHFCLGGDNAAAKMNVVAQQYDSALEGPGVTVDQLQSVANKMGARTPTSANILLDAYEDYAALLDVILGTGHEVAKHFHDFLYEMRNLRQQLDDRFANDDLAGQWLTREVHVQMDHWFAKQELTADPYPKPEFGVLVEMVRFDRAHNERRPVNSGGGRQPAGTPGGGGRGGGAGIQGGAASSPSAAPKEDNPHPCPTGLVRWDRWSVTRFKAQHPNQPQNDTGTPFCLSYHKRGTCYENCGRRGDHRAHNTQETAKLLAHLGAEALVGPPAPAP
jgi:hypothetical protein